MTTKTEEIAVRSETAVDVLQRSLAEIPTVDEDPTDSMLSYIASVPPENWEDLWAKLPNLKDNVGKSLRMHGFRVAPSDFEGKLNLYLIADVTWLKSGEKGLLSVSSTMCIGQLLTLFKNNYLPSDLEIVAKEKPTKAGFTPIHFRYLGKAIAAGDPRD